MGSCRNGSTGSQRNGDDCWIFCAELFCNLQEETKNARQWTDIYLVPNLFQ